MKAEDYFITLIGDIDTCLGLEGTSGCNCFCCKKFGYHSASVFHNPTGLRSEVLTKIMELPLKCHEECSIATIEDPRDVAINGLKRKIRLFCEEDEKMRQAQQSYKDPLNGSQIDAINQLKDLSDKLFYFLERHCFVGKPGQKLELAKESLVECVALTIQAFMSKY